MITMRRVSLYCALAASARAAELPGADDHALPCRPTIACTADLTPPGTFEIEFGYLLRRLAPSTWQHSTPLLLKLTTAEWLQLQVGTSGYVVGDDPKSSSYFDNVTLGSKFHLRDQTRGGPSISFSATVSVPTVSGQAGYVPTWAALFTLYVSKDIRWLHADLNLGANLFRLEGVPLTQAFATLALSTGLPHGVGLMLEAYGFTDANPFSSADAGVLAAICFQPRSWIVLDVGGDFGLVPATRAGSLFAGITFIPVVLWRRHQRSDLTTHESKD